MSAGAEIGIIDWGGSLGRNFGEEVSEWREETPLEGDEFD